MWISHRADAGLRAALELVQGRSPVPIAAGVPAVVSTRALSRRTGLSAAFLSQVLGGLRRRGLVESVAGRRGGYRLARPAEQITVGDVLRAAGATLAPIACADPGLAGSCEQKDHCRLRPVWLRVAEASRAVVDQVTLQDLAGT